MKNDVISKISGAFGAAAIVGGAGVMVKKVLDVSDAIGNMSEALGVSTDFLQGFSYAASQSGASAEDAQKAIEKLAVKIGDARQGGDEALATFKKLGVALTDGSGKARTTEDIFFDVADALAAIQDETVRTAVEMELLGKVGPKLAAMLAQGTAAIRKQMAEAPKLSADEIATLKEAGDAFDKLGKSVTTFFGTGLAGMYKLGRWLQDNNKLVRDFALGWREMFYNVKLPDIDPQLEALSDANQKAKRAAGGSSTISGKQQTEAMVKLGKEIAAIYSKMNAEERTAFEKMAFHQNEQLRLVKLFESAQDGTIEKKELELEIAKNLEQTEIARLAAQNAALTATEKKIALEKQIADAQRDLNAKQFDKLLPQSVGDVAGMDLSKKDPRVRDWWAGQQRLAQAAQDAQAKADEMAQAGVIGGTGGARAWQAAADRLKSNIRALPDDIRDPLKNERDRIKAMKDQVDALDTIIEQNKTGIAVIPVNPPSAK